MRVKEDVWCVGAAKELASISEQFPFEPLEFLPKMLRITFAEGIKMLNDAGHQVPTSMSDLPYSLTSFETDMVRCTRSYPFIKVSTYRKQLSMVNDGSVAENPFYLKRADCTALYVFRHSHVRHCSPSGIAYCSPSGIACTERSEIRQLWNHLSGCLRWSCHNRMASIV